MSKVHLEYVDDVNLRVVSEPHVLMELADHLTFKAENYKWDKRYKARLWNGDITLLNRYTGLVYAGLAHKVKKFCDAAGYAVTFDDELVYDNVSLEEVRHHIKMLNVPDWLEIRDYQIESVAKCLRSRRRTLISPTSSGKSFMIYLIATWYNKKSLIIVPTTGLVTQFESDLRSYGYTGKIMTSVNDNIKGNDLDAEIVITTWQTLDNGKSRLPEAWYQQFEVVFGDEAHGCKAKTLIKILTSMRNTRYRFGTTGTLNDQPLSRTTIEGLFGPIYQSTTTRELIDSGYAADIKIKSIVLRYPEDVRKAFHKPVYDAKVSKPRKKTYQEEIDFITQYEPRMKFIKNLTLSLEGNKLVFFRMVDHGERIFAAFEGQENVFYIDGSVTKDREKIRQAMEVLENAILVASLGTTSTGVSIKKLSHMISCAPMKAKIKLLQSIGRMLRQHSEKSHAVMYDIVDDISWGKNKNFALKHFEERAKIYDQENFDYKIYNVSLKDD